MSLNISAWSIRHPLPSVVFSIILLALDRKEVAQQAQAVTDTDYFRQLQSKARELRRQRSSGGNRTNE